ncbi:unnamed protein product [Caenorhabditis brenneri]
MTSFIKFVLFIGLLSIVSSQANFGSFYLQIICSEEQEAAQPCYCCRRSCWVKTAETTTQYFGKLLGERNGAKTMFSLSMMRKCMSNQCNSFCSDSTIQDNILGEFDMDNTWNQLELWFTHHKIFERCLDFRIGPTEDEPELAEAGSHDREIWTNDEEERHERSSVKETDHADAGQFAPFGHTSGSQAYSHPSGWLLPHTNVNAEEKEQAQLAMFHCIANQLFGGPLPRAVTNDFRDTTLNSVKKMGSKIERMTTTTGESITGISTSSNFSANEKYKEACEHYLSTPLCQHRLFQNSSDRLKLLFHPKVYSQMPQRVKRDNPTGKFLFENDMRKGPKLLMTRKELDEKWASLREQEKSVWYALAEAVNEERRLQVELGYIVKKTPKSAALRNSSRCYTKYNF